MRLDDEQESSNIEDRRGSGGGGGVGGLGIGTVLVVVVVSYFLGVDPRAVLGLLGGHGSAPAPAQHSPARPPAADDQAARFVAKVLGSTERTWAEVFAESHRNYVQPRLVLFTGSTPTACGTGQAAMGPFYCPGDSKVYIDLGFYDDLKNRYHAPGDFAQAYVIAHEVGHHVQHLLGISDKVHQAQQHARSEAESNALSVRLELQADCLAGVWAARANDARHILESGDVEEGLAAASAIGDDRLQKSARGYAVPDTFTHGSSAQRVEWFRRGLSSGDLNHCNTFQTARP